MEWREGRTNFDPFHVLPELVVNVSSAQRDVTLGTVESVTVVDHEVEIRFERFDRLILVRLELLLDHAEIPTLMRRNHRVVRRNLDGEVGDGHVERLSTVSCARLVSECEIKRSRRRVDSRSFLHQFFQHRSETSFRVVRQLARLLPFAPPRSIEDEDVPDGLGVGRVEFLTVCDNEVEI